MVEKIGKYGKYYGCSNFPKCSKTMTKEGRREKIQAAIKVSEIITTKRAAERKNQSTCNQAIKKKQASKKSGNLKKRDLRGTERAWIRVTNTYQAACDSQQDRQIAQPSRDTGMASIQARNG